MTALRWGVLGAAGIARKAFIPAIKKSEGNKISAIASRDMEKAELFCSDLQLECSIFDSYEKLILSDDIDAIYNPTPNHLHLELTQQAVRAGKHVLCEKPIGLNQKQARSLLEFCHEYPSIKVMEAFMYRFHPQWLKVKQLIKEGLIGELKHVHTHFCYFNDDPNNVRNQNSIGGGALLDIGCYAVSVARWLFEGLPDKVFASIERDPNFLTDVHTRGLMEFNSGSASFYCSTLSSTGQSVEISGQKGKIIVPLPFNPNPAQETEIHLYTSAELKTFRFDPADQYLAQLQAFENCVKNDVPVPTPLDDALHNMIVIDALFKSGREGLAIEID
jgi:predicted dehydrogenase